MSNNAILTIHRDIIKENFNIIKNFVGNTPIAAMLKANAYGGNAHNMFSLLYSQGVKNFFVAQLDEAMQVKDFVAKDNINIYILHDITEDNYQQILEHNFIPVLNSVRDIKLWLEKGFHLSLAEMSKSDQDSSSNHSPLAGESKATKSSFGGGTNTNQNKNSRAPCVIHFDSGLNRLGISEKEAIDLHKKGIFEKLNISYVMTHFAFPNDPDTTYTEWQFENFKRVMPLFPKGTKFSSAKSNAVFQDKRYHLDLVRPGSALYGINPIFKGKNPLKNPIEIEAKIIQIKDVKKGAKIGYNQTYTMPYDGKIAIVGIGYADSMLRSHANSGCFYFGDTKLPILGAVAMDLTTVDITDVKEEIKEGDSVEIIGKHQDLDTFGASAGTTGYEILTSLSKRYIWKFK